MQEIFEKIIKKLIEMKQVRVEQCHEDYEIEVMTERDFDDAIEIVKQVVEEYKNGHFGCNSNGQHEKCKDCGLRGECSHCNTEWFGVPEINVGENDEFCEWIPCSERLPDESGKYTVCTEKGSVYCAKFTAGKKGKFFHTDMYTHIIAWQPLPAPYKPKGAGNEQTKNN